jgi:hypothetical protein
MRITITISAFALLVACGGGAPEAQAPTSAAAPAAAGGDKKAAGDKDEAAKKAAALDALTAEEAKTGTCDADHKEALEKLLSEIETSMKAKSGEDGKPLGLQVVGRRVLALGSSPKGVEMSVSGRGTELHVLSYGVKEISLDVLQGTTAATTLRSPFQRTSTASPPELGLTKLGKVGDLQSDSRQVQIKPGQPLQVRLTGQGCAAFVLFLKP